MKRKYLPISLYLTAFLVAALIPVALTAYFSLAQAERIEKQADRQNRAGAYTEFEAVLADIDRSMTRVARNLSHWDETVLNFSDSTYYQYWRDNRLHNAGVLDGVIDAVELYGADGSPLAPDNRIAGNWSGGRKEHTVLSNMRGAPYLLRYQPVYPGRDVLPGQSPVGYIALRVDLRKAVVSRGLLTRSDPTAIEWRLDEGESVPIEDAARYVRLSVLQTPEIRELSRLVRSGFVEYIFFSAALLLSFSMLLVFSLGRPLHRMAQHIKALRDGAALEIPPSIQSRVGVAELEKVRKAVNEYRDNFHAARDTLVEKNLELERLTYRDILTGIFNRRAFESHLSMALETARSEGRHHTLCYLDLDQFKVVNDTCGHLAGDELLKQVAARLQGKLRESDILARLGGDEFGVLLDNCPIERAGVIAEDLRKTVKTFRFCWEDKVFDIGVSIGLVEISPKVTTLADLFKEADAACYMAKDLGRNRVQVYQPDDEVLAQRYGEMQWVSRIAQAFEDKRFVLYSQEIAPLSPREGDRLHVELLIRMLDENGELVPPMAFLPAAERYSLIGDIDRWVLEAACDILARYQSTWRTQPPIVAINVSGQSLGDPTFLDFVVERLKGTDIEPGQFCFEITETSAITHLVSAKQFIGVLRQMGCHFALDDFGSGLSSFAYLKNLHVDCLKIDGHFVKHMADDPIDRAMVASINEIGHLMNMRTVGEFVENEEILAALREIGVDYVQGFGIAKPVPFEEALLRAAETERKNASTKVAAGRDGR